MSEIKDNIAKNISVLRKHHKMTQLELAEKINYSDKAVSRWESGDVTPDIETLHSLSVIFDVPLAKLFEEQLSPVDISKEHKQERVNRLTITLLAITLVWTAATIVYVYSNLIDGTNNWKIFIYSLPATFLIALIFNSVWGKKKFNYIWVSALAWSLLVSVFFYMLPFRVWPLFILGAPFEVAVILWSKIRK